jgi:hypothetical protein
VQAGAVVPGDVLHDRPAGPRSGSASDDLAELWAASQSASRSASSITTAPGPVSAASTAASSSVPRSDCSKEQAMPGWLARDVLGQVAGPQPGQRVIVPLGQLEHQLVLAHGRDPPGQQGPVPGHDQVDPGAGSLGQDPGDHVGERAAARLAQRGDKAFPPSSSSRTCGSRPPTAGKINQAERDGRTPRSRRPAGPVLAYPRYAPLGQGDGDRGVGDQPEPAPLIPGHPKGDQDIGSCAPRRQNPGLICGSGSA